MLSAQLCDEVVKARGIAAWPSKTGDETEFDRIPGDEEHNWNRCGRRLSCDCCRDGACDDHRHLTVHNSARSEKAGDCRGGLTVYNYSPFRSARCGAPRTWYAPVSRGVAAAESTPRQV